jgi:hypothetical protein
MAYPDDFFEALNILNGLTERCQECGRAISEDEFRVNWQSCELCLDAAIEEYYLAEAAKAEREYEQLKEFGQI